MRTTVESNDGRKIAYAHHGDGPETVVFLPDAGFGPWMWSWQVPRMTGPFRTVILATRGTDGSDDAGPYTVDRLVDDLETVTGDVGARRVHLVGAGLGGTVAIEYARKYGRARGLVLLGATRSGDVIDPRTLERLCPDTDDPAKYEASLSLAFSDDYLSSADVHPIIEWRRDEDARGEALDRHLSVVRSYESEALFDVENSALVCHGVDDPVVPIDAGRDLASELPGGRFEPIEGKRLCFVEHSAAVTDAIVGFLERESGEA
ncbi:MAG: alpha/beta fold hydrolase [Natronomonas sp.]